MIKLLTVTPVLTWGDIEYLVILGGLGLFLFGIKLLGDGLKSLAGDKLRDLIDKYTSKAWMGLIIGAFVTVIIQSSSATTAITIGFVRAGLMRLEQTVGIIFGANIGTTVTSFLIGIKVERYALFFVFVGALFVLFGKRRKYTYWGEISLGFGILFYGLMLMGDALKDLKYINDFHNLALSLAKNPLQSVFGGILMTGIIQSSSASIGIIQKLYDAQAIGFTAVLPFIFGANIGTTVTAALAAMGGSLASRRAAGIHTMFNVLVSIIGLLLLNPYIHLIDFITSALHLEPMMQVSVAHIIFNLMGALIFYPFIKYMVLIIKKIIRGDDKERIEVNTNEFDTKLAHSLPSGALAISKKATLKMGELATEIMSTTRHYFNKEQKVNLDSIKQLEDVINNIDTKITDYLLIISKETLGEKDIDTNSINLQIVKNLERIGDLAMNLGEFYDFVFDARENFSEEAKVDINGMYDTIEHMLNRSLRIYADNDFSLSTSVEEDESYIDLLEYKARERHFDRMRKETCTTAVGSSVFVDILGTLERIADHVQNIAHSAVSVRSEHELKSIEKIEVED